MCETLEEIPKEKKNFFQRFKKEEIPLTAEMAWYESTHGEGSYLPLSQRIKEKQEDIAIVIKSKFAPGSNANMISKASFHCVVDIEEDLIAYTEQVLQPFKEGGFEIVDLSKECKSVSESGVFLIGWKNAFKNIKTTQKV